MSVSDDDMLTNKTYVMSAKGKTDHPPYFDMVQEGIKNLAGRNGVSKSKIHGFIKEQYSVDANNMFVKKALKKGLENGTFENKTGTGASGSFKLTKEFKEKQISKEKMKLKKEKKILKEKESENNDQEKVKKKPAKSKSKSKDDIEIKTKATKKSSSVSKDKENAAPKEIEKGEHKLLKEKVKKISKANSTGNMKKKIIKSLPPADENNGDDENVGDNEEDQRPTTSRKRTKKAAAKK